MQIDDPKLEPIWELCARYKRPVVIHTSDPAAFFTPLDRFNERWHELNEHPDWLFYGERFPKKEELLAQRNRVIAKHPQTTFICAHFCNNPEDLATVGKWLDTHPNMYTDIDARISELGRQPWLAYGLLRTSEGASPNVSSGNVLFTLIGFAGMYMVMGLLYILLMVREVAHGPEAGSEEPGIAGLPWTVMSCARWYAR